MSFSHDIAGGQGNLIVPAVKSPNFVHGVSGWAINSDGSAEFHDIELPSGSGGATIYFAAAAPVGANTGDLWYNTADGLELSQWNGTTWVAYQIGTGAIASGAITNTQLAGSVTARSLGGITTTISGTAPASPKAGDLWINSAGGFQLNQYSGSAWVALSWNASDVISAATITGSLVAASTITGGNIAAGTVTASNIQAATITGSLIAAATITASNIQSGTITASQIAANTVTAAQMAAATITASQIAAGTITGSNIAAATIDGINPSAGFHGLNMVTDPQFSNSALNSVRLSDPVTSAGWTLSGGTAQAVAGTPAKRLALMPSASKAMWMNPGEQYYLSVTGVTSASCQVGIEIEYDNGTATTLNATFTGTQTVSGIVTVPAGAHYGYARVFCFAGSGSPTATLSKPVCQPAQITGSDWIINGNGMFWYSATPAAGNLIASVAAVAGTDGFSNPYQAGINIYGAVNGLLGMEFFGGGNPAGIRMVPDNAPSSIFSDPGIASFSNGAGTAQYTGAALESGEIASGSGVATVTAYGGSTDGTTSVPHVQVNGGATGGTQLADINQNGIIFSPATQSWMAVGSKTDTTNITMGNVISPDQITVPYTIDSPLVSGTVYELAAEFSGSWGNQLLSFYADINGSFTVPLAVIGAAFGSLGDAYNGWIRLIVRITSATACHVHVQGGMANITLNSGHLLDGSNTLDITSAPTSGTVIAAGDNISIAAAWGASATQSLTTFGSTFTRSGNP